jgi:hypothetical protein
VVELDGWIATRSHGTRLVTGSLDDGRSPSTVEDRMTLNRMIPDPVISDRAQSVPQESLEGLVALLRDGRSYYRHAVVHTKTWRHGTRSVSPPKRATG